MRVIEGSSPLTRGKLAVKSYGWDGTGLIPAHAGKTWRSRRAWARRWAHPRSRGENFAPAFCRATNGGSSPLTRGKRALATDRRGRRGLIPAHAGKTQQTERGCAGSRAHPRSRGENPADSVYLSKLLGSSPLTRGKPRRRISDASVPWLIPAHAGKTSCLATRLAATWAHPRSRGENIPRDPMVIHLLGSSPLTRGKQLVRVVRCAQFGLIPAHAGKTRFQRPCHNH